MKNRNQKVGFITDRDRELFAFLFKHKISTHRQIQKYIFSDCDVSICNRRIRKLKNSGLINTSVLSINNKMVFGLSITKKAFEEIEFNDREKLLQLQLKSDSKNHDLKLVDIYQKLQRFKNIQQIYTENELQTWSNFKQSKTFRDFFKIYSDLVAYINITPKLAYWVPIELEQTLKSKQRCTDKIQQYYDSNCAAVIYIYKDYSILKRFQDIEKIVGQGKTKKVYYASYSQFQNNMKNIVCSNQSGASFKLE